MFNSCVCAANLTGFDAGLGSVSLDREPRVILSRRLVVPRKRGQPARECLMEIGFRPTAFSIDGKPAVAVVRVSPFGDWLSVEGEDMIQALELAIRTAKSEAEAWGADWPDED